MLSNKEITAKARECLKGHWGSTIVASIAFLIVYFILFFAISLCQIPFTELLGETLGDIIGNIVTTILEFLFIFPLVIGIFQFFCKLVNSGDETLGDIFKPIADLFHVNRRKVYWRNIRASLLFFLFGVIIIFVSFIPFFMMGGFLALGSNAEQASAEVFNTSAFTGLGFSLILYTIALVLYLPTVSIFNYRLATDDTVMAWSCLKESYKITVGHRNQYWKLCFRFFGWMCLCSITLGIAILWVGPYISTAFTVFCKELLNTSSSTQPQAEN